MVCLVQVAAEPERRLAPISPISFRPTPRWLTPPLAADGAELVGVSGYPRRMTVPM